MGWGWQTASSGFWPNTAEMPVNLGGKTGGSTDNAKTAWPAYKEEYLKARLAKLDKDTDGSAPEQLKEKVAMHTDQEADECPRDTKLPENEITGLQGEARPQEGSQDQHRYAQREGEEDRSHL